MVKFFFSLNSVSSLLKNSAPGSFTPESVAKAREISEDLTKNIAIKARELANNAKRKRVTESEIKLASQFFIKQ